MGIELADLVEYILEGIRTWASQKVESFKAILLLFILI